jgi:hypothetical protein
MVMILGLFRGSKSDLRISFWSVNVSFINGISLMTDDVGAILRIIFRSGNLLLINNDVMNMQDLIPV